MSAESSFAAACRSAASDLSIVSDDARYKAEQSMSDDARNIWLNRARDVDARAAALTQLAALVEEAGAITSALPNRVLDAHSRIRALLQSLAAGFDPATEGQ